MQRIQSIEAALKPAQPVSLKGLTLVVTGGSRGIGLAIARRCARDGCNVAILAKTATQNPKLPGTIYSAAAQVQKAGGKALPLVCDVRYQKEVVACIDKVVAHFGGIDILINNASAISLRDIESTPMKSYDLMHQINGRGTFLLTKHCLPHLRKSKHGHVLNMSPPLNLKPQHFRAHTAYTISKYNMSMVALGLAAELENEPNLTSNCLWPRTAIATAAVKNLLGGDQSIRKSRTDEIMADASYIILTTKPSLLKGQFLVDDEVLRKAGISDLRRYQVDQKVAESDLMPDLFLD